MPTDASQIFAFAEDLKRVPGRVGREVASAVRRSAKDLQQTAQAAAPRRTGKLAESIKVTTSGGGSSGAISAKVGTDLSYARFVEDGTSRMAPEPFLDPSVDTIEDSFYDAVEKAVGNGLDT